MESPAVDASSSDVLLYVLIGAGVVLVVAIVLVALWLSKRSSAPAQPPAVGGPAGPPTQPMSPGWYPDPHGQARLRWYDGRQWTANAQD